MKTNIHIIAGVLSIAGLVTSCNDYLDKEPLSSVSPEKYFNDEASFETYCNGRYTDVLISHGNWSYGIYGDDNNTDNMASLVPDGKYIKGDWKTSLDDGDNWKWTNINAINYFFDQALEKFESGKVTGNANKISHYVGEMYFFRAYEYFKLLKRYGDLPIIEHSLPDDLAALTEASRRYPRNEVARFILADLDKAYELLGKSKEATTRINANTAMLLKSRVALYEGSFLKNFAGTAFVPGSNEWPGKSKSYNSDFKFEAGSIEAEYNWFFDQAIEASEIVANEAKSSLTANTGIVPQEEGLSLTQYENQNPWLAMFGSLDLSKYPEVLLWREYNNSLGINHNVVVQAQRGNQGCGTTRGMVNAFVMKNGLPIYAQGSLYKGDGTIHDVRTDRDPRLFVLLKEPGQKNVLIAGNGDHANVTEGIPELLDNSSEKNYSTGYALRKGNTYDQNECGNGKASTACPVFRSVEALLNYIEAYYERHGALGGRCDEFWKAIRGRHAGLETDYQITINATDMSEEAKGDWGAYTAGVLIDPVRYNIRRERRCELMAEGFRWDDLVRWRSLDQMTTTGYHIEGIHLWNSPMIKYFANYGSGDNADPAKLEANFRKSLSLPEKTGSDYLRPHEGNNATNVLDGLKWSMAQYLRPIPIKQMMLTSPDGKTVADSPLYQNPYWPSEPSLPATK